MYQKENLNQVILFCSGEMVLDEMIFSVENECTLYMKFYQL